MEAAAAILVLIILGSLWGIWRINKWLDTPIKPSPRPVLSDGARRDVSKALERHAAREAEKPVEPPKTPAKAEPKHKAPKGSYNASEPLKALPADEDRIVLTAEEGEQIIAELYDEPKVVRPLAERIKAILEEDKTEPVSARGAQWDAGFQQGMREGSKARQVQIDCLERKVDDLSAETASQQRLIEILESEKAEAWARVRLNNGPAGVKRLGENKTFVPEPQEDGAKVRNARGEVFVRDPETPSRYIPWMRIEGGPRAWLSWVAVQANEVLESEVPKVRTKEENIAFRKSWDDRVKAGWVRQGKCPTCGGEAVREEDGKRWCQEKHSFGIIDAGVKTA